MEMTVDLAAEAEELIILMVILHLHQEVKADQEILQQQVLHKEMTVDKVILLHSHKEILKALLVAEAEALVKQVFKLEIVMEEKVEMEFNLQ
jgi:hypothetical protein